MGPGRTRGKKEHKLLADAMARHGYSAGLTLSEGVIVVNVVFQGRSHDIPGLAAALGEEAPAAFRQGTGDPGESSSKRGGRDAARADHGGGGRGQADERGAGIAPDVDRDEVRLIWQQTRDAPDGLGKIRHKLRQTIDAWSSDDRAAVGAFLQQRIAAEHADNPAAGWTEALTAALDYRRWHEFTIQRFAGGQWRPATGRRRVVSGPDRLRSAVRRGVFALQVGGQPPCATADRARRGLRGRQR